ncbi:MAG: hypothetical protein GY797_17285, partial [Deltaproteobacteria bacterium]|nr:hypothetical protein [Deltaproteobacteria bacterium]
EVFKKHQKRSILLLISFVVVLVLFKESYAILTVKLVVNPDKTVVPVGSDPITLTAKASGSNLKFEWKLLGPGKIEGFITGPAVFYIPPEKIDSKAVDVIITLKVTDAKGQEVTENLILTIASNGADVPTITPTPVPTRAPRPTPEKEDKLEQLKLEFCKERLPQLLQQTLCQHYEKYQKLKKKVQQEDNTINQTILVFKDIVGNLKESKTCVETITREDPESPLKDFIPRLKKILDRSKKIENSQQTLVLGDFTFIPLRCQPIAS